MKILMKKMKIFKKENFKNKLEKVQYRTCLVITGAVQRTSRQKLYGELGLHSLSKRRCHNKLIFFYKIFNMKLIPLFVPKIPLSEELPFEISIN